MESKNGESTMRETDTREYNTRWFFSDENPEVKCRLGHKRRKFYFDKPKEKSKCGICRWIVEEGEMDVAEELESGCPERRGGVKTIN